MHEIHCVTLCEHRLKAEVLNLSGGFSLSLCLPLALGRLKGQLHVIDQDTSAVAVKRVRA